MPLEDSNLRTLVPTLVVLLTVAAACGHAPFIRAEDVPETASDGADYRIAPGDFLNVRVWNQDSVSTGRTQVREDGKISVPFLQDVEVSGMTPAEIASRLQVKLKTYIVSPVVTVVLEQRAPMRISVLGEVRTPGTYELQAGAGVLHALAAAGGLTDYAQRDGIYVLRNGYWADGNPAPARIRFRWDALANGARKSATFRLRSGDVVVVE